MPDKSTDPFDEHYFNLFILDHAPGGKLEIICSLLFLSFSPQSLLTSFLQEAYPLPLVALRSSG